MKNDNTACPHCRQPLTTWEPCPESGWDEDLYYCENNECSYFVKGREKICREYDMNFSYRFCLNPRTGKEFPLVAWCGGDLSLLKGRCEETPDMKEKPRNPGGATCETVTGPE